MGLATENVAEQWFACSVGALAMPLFYSQRTDLLLALLAFSVLGLALLFLFRLPVASELPQRLGWLCLGLLYLPFLLGHLGALRLLPDGREWIFLTLLVIMGCDTFAYFIGVTIGRHKLYPAVSPNKSIEGALGGLLGAVIAVFVCRAVLLPGIGVVEAILIGLLLGVAGQLGDLFESLLKRACNVKDSGNMIPGHGGLLDRLDSLLFAFPIVYYLARYGHGG